jgi:hypothetical protein
VVLCDVDLCCVGWALAIVATGLAIVVLGFVLFGGLPASRYHGYELIRDTAVAL